MNPLPVRIGLTGSIGAGKSTVSALLRELGATVLDADAVAREVTADPQVLSELERHFPGVVAEGVLDRAALAAQVFGQPAALAQLNAITHPRVRERMKTLEAQAVAAGAAVVVQDVPLLLENGLGENFDAVWVVDAPLETRVQRVMARSGLSHQEVLARDARQMPAAQKREQADLVLDNSGDTRALRQQVLLALTALQSSKGGVERSGAGS